MAGVIDDLSARLQEEADLCRNEGADDCAQLFDEANQSIETLHDRLRGLEAERDRLLQQIDEWVKKGETRVKSIDLREERDRLQARVLELEAQINRGADQLAASIQQCDRLRAENEALLAANRDANSSRSRIAGYWEEYGCGCVSKTERKKKDLFGYCPKHGDDRVNVHVEFPERKERQP